MSVTHNNSTENKAKNGKRREKTGQTKTIEFDEVFQGGQARYKHRILEHPEDSGDWYILRCDDHDVHFGFRAAFSAARHLHHRDHGLPYQGGADAIRELGIRVLSCDATKAKQNNDAFTSALKKGYQVYKGIHSEDLHNSQPPPPARRGLRGRRERDCSSEDEEQVAQQVQRTLKPFDGITNPVAGNLYLGYWRSRNPSSPSCWHAVVVLPLGDFEAMGLSGSIFETRLIKGHIPFCYDSVKSTRTILGWAEGFKDGGPDVTKRKFPVMYFEDDQTTATDGGLLVPSPDSLAWLQAGWLRPFSEYSPENLPVLGYDAALDFSERRRAVVTSALPSPREDSVQVERQISGALLTIGAKGITLYRY